MDINLLLSKVDHTLLSPVAVFSDIKKLCDQGVKYKTASVCIAPCHVGNAKKYVEGKIRICTVVGFPNGYSSTATKIFETEDAINNGADEIDMVINIGSLKEKNYSYIANEIRSVKKACKDKILKVIIETCLLTDEEKIKMCEIISSEGADFIKTSTGFSKSGAKKEDIILFKKYLGKSCVKIKAAGGISSIKDAEDFINLGADRLGTSKVIKLLENG